MTDLLDTRALRDLAKVANLLESHYRDISVTEVAITLRSAAEEVDRLHALIENAPHDPTHCWAAFKSTEGAACTCWKSRVNDIDPSTIRDVTPPKDAA